MSSLEDIKNLDITEFLNWTSEAQKKFLQGIEITPLKHPKEENALKKFIALKILMEARIAVETEHFFDLKRQIAKLFSHKSIVTSENSAYQLKTSSNRHSMWIGLNAENKLEIKDAMHTDIPDNYTDPEELRKIFSVIKAYVKGNTLGLNLFLESALFSADFYNPYEESGQSLSFYLSLIVPLVVAIPCLVLTALEYLLITPIKYLVDKLRGDPYEDFIKQLEQAPDPSTAEMSKNAVMDAEALRDNDPVAILPRDVANIIIAMFVDDDIHTDEEALSTAMSINK